MERLIIATVFMVMTAFPLAAFSQHASIKPDERIKLALEKVNLTYEVDKKGIFNFDITFDDKRKQNVFIESKTDLIGDFEVRKITSIGFISKTPLSAERENELLSRSVITPIGAWSIIKLDDGTYIIEFIAKVSASMDDKQLLAVVSFVASEADTIEKEFTGKDEF